MPDIPLASFEPTRSAPPAHPAQAQGLPTSGVAEGYITAVRTDGSGTGFRLGGVWYESEATDPNYPGLLLAGLTAAIEQVHVELRWSARAWDLGVRRVDVLTQRRL